MSCRSTKIVSSFVLGAVLWAAVAAPATATPKEPVRITQGTGPATLTAAERAKAEAHGIRIPDSAAPAVVRVEPSLLRIERRPLDARPTDSGTRVPSFGARDRRKPDGLGPIDAAKTGPRP